MRALLGRIRRRLSEAVGVIEDRRRQELIARGAPARGRVAVFYGRDIPGPTDPAHGGLIKFQELASALPNDRASFNVLYLGSSTFPRDGADLVKLARARGAAFVWNQNGVAYPGWHGPGWEAVNAPRGQAFHESDYVLYQSAFCKLSADTFYGARDGAWEILHNPVDTARFVPAERRPERPTLLLAGTQYQRYRLETALQTLARLPREWRLLVSGELTWNGDARASRREAQDLLTELGLAERVELLGPHTQAAAPGLYQRAGILLHTKYNDPCPTVVLEAMACGLPVVYSASGGVPELVAQDAGMGIPAPLDWEQDHPPDPDELAAAVEGLAGRLEEASTAARRCSLRFDVEAWVARHRALFEELTS
jgi:glycosyltransferase involved in cell wall biosynthesis